MYLVRITSDRLDHDTRTFECSECDHSATERLKLTTEVPAS